MIGGGTCSPSVAARRNGDWDFPLLRRLFTQSLHFGLEPNVQPRSRNATDAA